MSGFDSFLLQTCAKREEKERRDEEMMDWRDDDDRGCPGHVRGD